MDPAEFARYVRLTAFLLHLAFALGVLGVAFGCRVERFANWGYRSAPMEGACANASAAECWRGGAGWADDEPVPHHGWNPYGLVLAFEWVSAAFALFYLRDRAWLAGRGAYLAMAWLLAGAAVYMGFYFFRGAGNWCEPVAVGLSLSLAGAVLSRYDGWRDEFVRAVAEGAAEAMSYRMHQQNGILWRVPLGAEPAGAWDARRLEARLAVMLRYGEYCITAPLLYVAVLTLFVVGPPAWAFVAGYLGVFVCNCLGLALHLIHVEIQDAPEQGGNTEGWAVKWAHRRMGARPAHTAAALLGVGTWREHWVARLAYLEGSWLGLLVGMMFVFYFGRPYLFNSAVPVVVLLSLWNLVLSYCLFGIVGTYFYVFDAKWPYMDPAFDVLSLAAKIPIAGAVCVAFLSMPGGGCR